MVLRYLSHISLIIINGWSIDSLVGLCGQLTLVTSLGNRKLNLIVSVMYSKRFRTVEISQHLSAVGTSEMSAQCLTNKPNAQVPVDLK